MNNKEYRAKIKKLQRKIEKRTEETAKYTSHQQAKIVGYISEIETLTELQNGKQQLANDIDKILKGEDAAVLHLKDRKASGA